MGVRPLCRIRIKSLHVAVVIWGTLVNTQIHTETDRQLLTTTSSVS